MKIHGDIESRRSGFTLIEILVTITILAMIFSIVFGTFFYTVSNAETQEERAAIYHRASFILNNICQNLASAYVPFGGYYSEEDNERKIFLGMHDSVEDASADALSAFTTNPRFASRNMAGEIAYVSYAVTAADSGAANSVKDENNPLVLKCTVEPLMLEPDEEGGGKVEWEQNIRSLKIEYYDGASWSPEWSYADQKLLPNAVRATLELADSNGNTYSFSTIARVQANTLLEEPPEESTEEAEPTDAATEGNEQPEVISPSGQETTSSSPTG